MELQAGSRPKGVGQYQSFLCVRAGNLFLECTLADASAALTDKKGDQLATVDIVVPCYRYGRFLPECIGSILSQSFQDFRVLIIDDASPDESSAIAVRCAASDHRIEVVLHDTNRGHIETYNEGIEWAASPYFLLLSADDFLAPGAIGRAVAIMETHREVTLTYGDCIEVQTDEPTVHIPDETGPVSWDIRSGRAFVAETCDTIRNNVPTPTAIVRTDVQKRIGGYRKELNHAGDMAMWLCFASQGMVARTRSVQAFYRIHDNNMSKPFYESVINDYEQRAMALDFFFGRYGAVIDAAPELRRLANKRLGDAAFWTGMAQMGRGNSRLGRDLLGFSRRRNSRSVWLPPLGHLWRVDQPNRKIIAALSDLLRG